MSRIRNAVAVTIVVLACIGCGDKTNKTKLPIRVKTEVTSTAMSGTGKHYVGIIEEREATAVSFTTMGVVKRLLVSEGQAVAKGQLLAEIDPTSTANTVEAAVASTSQAHDMVEQARSVYAQAKDAYDRMKLLHDNGSLPEIKWIEAETRLRQAETSLRTAEAGVRSANAAEKIVRKNLADTRLYAPVSGIIGRKQVGAGETALPSQAIVTILDISTVKVKVSIPEQEMGSIGTQTPSHVFVGAADRHVNGGRIEKGVQADALTHTYDVRINVPNPDRRLLPGMVADVTLGGEASHSGIMLPVASVQRKSDGSLFVWTVGSDSTAHRSTVTIGKTGGNRVAITSGLAYDQRVVVEGYQKLSEGTKVVY